MVDLKPGWHVNGVYREACASEGPCPYYFGRAVAGGCRYFMVFRFKDARVNDVDLSGITAVYNGDIPHPGFDELISMGSEGGIYVSQNATQEQREILDTLLVESIGAALMKRVSEIRYVPIDIEDDGKTVEFRHPYGSMRQSLSKGQDGTPVVLENQVLPFLTNVKACHSDYWNYEDHGRHFDYKDRCGVWADFEFKG